MLQLQTERYEEYHLSQNEPGCTARVAFSSTQARQVSLLRLARRFTRTLSLVFEDALADALKRLKAAPERCDSDLGDEVTSKCAV
jgi:hypothetical protein